jgi:hypothetical protein
MKTILVYDKDYPMREPREVVEEWYVKVQGKLVVARNNLPKPKPHKRGPRGNCKGFTRPSRLRLLKWIATIDWRKVPDALLITLTYPDEVGVRTYKERSKDISRFVRYVEGYLGYHVAVLWRCEWKKRQSGQNVGKLFPHIHLLTFGASYVAHQKIREWWRGITKAEGPLATDVRKAKKGEVAAVYVAKYCAKVDEFGSLDYASYLNTLGRGWGVRRRSLVPLHHVRWYLRLDQEMVHRLKGIAAEKLPWYDASLDEGFTLFGGIAVYVAKLLSVKALDKENLGGYADEVEGGEGPDGC